MQVGLSKQMGKGDAFLCDRRAHLPYQTMKAFFGPVEIGSSSIWTDKVVLTELQEIVFIFFLVYLPYSSYASRDMLS